MYRERCKVVSQKRVAPGHFVLTLQSKQIAREAKPGQFVQILCEDATEPLLPRPFSYLSVEKNRFSILYHVVGKGTAILAKKAKGDALWVLGSCGNGFSLADHRQKHSGMTSKILMVGGGVGIPPLHHWAKELIKNKFPKKNIHIFLGARDKSLLLCEKEFKKLGVELHLATDNGSRGHKGFVTDILSRKLTEIAAGDAETGRPSRRGARAKGEDASTDGAVAAAGPAALARISASPATDFRIFTCGPTPMMKAVSEIAQKFSIPCQVSVEVPMACGYGACLGCAVTVREGESHRYAIACCEGPVFDGYKLVW